MNNVLDQLQDEAISTELDLIRMEAATQAKVAKLLKKLENEITSELAAADIPGVKMTAYKQARLSALLTEVKSLSSKTYKQVEATVNSDLMSAAKELGQRAADSLNGVIGTSFAKASLPPSLLEKLVSNTVVEGAPSAEWWGRQSPNLVTGFSDQMRLGIAKGETVDQLIQRVRGAPARNGQMAKAGLMTVKKHQAAAIVRTSMQTITNETRLEVWKQNNDLVKGVRWVATLDNRTTPICRNLDGKGWVYDKDGNLVPEGHDTQFPGPTAHWGCRSVQVPWTKSWAELTKEAGGDKTLAKKLDKVPPSTRASMNGQVPKSMTYDAWLKTQPEGVVKKALGTEANFRLWQASKVGASLSMTAAVVNQPPRFKVEVDVAHSTGENDEGGTVIVERTKKLRSAFNDFLRQLDTDSQKVITRYTSHSTELNRHLSGVKTITVDTLREMAEKDIAKIDAVFAKAPPVPDDMVAFSGVQGSIKNQLMSLKVGEEMTVKRYLSSSLAGSSAADFVDDGRVFMQIAVPKGNHNAMYIEELALQAMKRERELLFNRGSTFKLLGKKKLGDYTYYIMEAIEK